MSAPDGLTTIRFGTDGWRAVIAEGFSFFNLERVAQAYACFLKQQAANSPASGESGSASPSLVIVGYDRRFLSEHFAARAAEVLAGNGLRWRSFLKLSRHLWSLGLCANRMLWVA